MHYPRWATVVVCCRYHLLFLCANLASECHQQIQNYRKRDWKKKIKPYVIISTGISTNCRNKTTCNTFIGGKHFVVSVLCSFSFLRTNLQTSFFAIYFANTVHVYRSQVRKKIWYTWTSCSQSFRSEECNFKCDRAESITLWC